MARSDLNKAGKTKQQESDDGMEFILAMTALAQLEREEAENMAKASAARVKEARAKVREIEVRKSSGSENDKAPKKIPRTGETLPGVKTTMAEKTIEEPAAEPASAQTEQVNSE